MFWEGELTDGLARLLAAVFKADHCKLVSDSSFPPIQPPGTTIAANSVDSDR